MLARSDTALIPVMEKLASVGIEAAYFVPTDVAMRKSIVDAHGALRSYLAQKSVHDFSKQGKGPGNKVLIPVRMLLPDREVETKVSLYRPETKDGDPRIWIYGLDQYAVAWNLIAIFEKQGALYAFNASNSAVLKGSTDPATPLGAVASAGTRSLDAAASELRGLLIAVAKKGFIKTLRPGPTGVGMTLETELGIPANSSRNPDFKGIEIKATRLTGVNQSLGSTRVNLFSKTPDWKTSPVKSGRALLDRLGYLDSETGRKQLYCTVNNLPNPQKLWLSIDQEPDLLWCLAKDRAPREEIVKWSMKSLRDRLKKKHRSTFWVKARVSHLDGSAEHFHYVEVEHTESAMTENLAYLIELGVVTFDFTLSLISDSKSKALRARDHGYLFKIRPSNLSLLFPPSKRYVLI